MKTSPGTGAAVSIVLTNRRPRKSCPHCTPRSDEDKRAAAEHWARVRVERARERNAGSKLAMLADRQERLSAERTLAG